MTNNEVLEHSYDILDSSFYSRFCSIELEIITRVDRQLLDRFSLSRISMDRIGSMCNTSSPDNRGDSMPSNR